VAIEASETTSLPHQRPGRSSRVPLSNCSTRSAPLIEPRQLLEPLAGDLRAIAAKYRRTWPVGERPRHFLPTPRSHTLNTVVVRIRP